MLTKPSRFLKIMWLPEYNILDKKAQWITITSMWAHVIRQKQSLWNVQQHSNKIKIQNQVSGASSLRPNPVSQEKGESQIQGPQKAKSTCLNVTLITLFFISINTKPNWLCFPLSLKKFFLFGVLKKDLQEEEEMEAIQSWVSDHKLTSIGKL